MCNYKKIFYGRSIEKKIDFLKSHHFDKNNEFIINLIKRTEDPCNLWYLITLIDLAGELEVKDKALLNRYISYLISPNNYYLKLSVLDYICDTFELYSDEDIDYSFLEKILINKHERLIVKNQVLIALLLINKKNSAEYTFLLKRNLLKTNDYRSHIRVYNSIMRYELCHSVIPASSVEELIKITIGKKFGKSVNEVINKIRFECNILEQEK